MINILIIEDDKMVAGNIKEFLELHFSENISKINIAESGRKAELLLESPTRYSIILWDYELQDGKSASLIDFFPDYSDVILMSIHEEALIDSLRKKWNTKVNSFEPITTSQKRDLITEPKNKLLTSDSIFYHLVDRKIQSLNSNIVKLNGYNNISLEINPNDIILVSNPKGNYIEVYEGESKVSASDILDNSKIIFSNRNEIYVSENKYSSVKNFLEVELDSYKNDFICRDDILINTNYISNCKYNLSGDISFSIKCNLEEGVSTSIRKERKIIIEGKEKRKSTNYIIKSRKIDQLPLFINSNNTNFLQIEKTLKLSHLL